MFKNRALQMTLVNNTPASGGDDMTGAFEVCSSEIFNSILKDHTKNVAKTVVAAYAAVKLIQTASEIALKLTPTR